MNFHRNYKLCLLINFATLTCAAKYVKYLALPLGFDLWRTSEEGLMEPEVWERQVLAQQVELKR